MLAAEVRRLRCAHVFAHKGETKKWERQKVPACFQYYSALFVRRPFSHLFCFCLFFQFCTFHPTLSISKNHQGILENHSSAHSSRFLSCFQNESENHSRLVKTFLFGSSPCQPQSYLFAKSSCITLSTHMLRHKLCDISI